MLGGCLLVSVHQLLLTNLLLALRVLLTLGALLRSGLLYLLLHLRNLGTCQDRTDAVVHLVDHIIPHLGTLQFEDQQRILLLVAGVLYRVLQFVELAQVLLPRIVDNVEQDALLKLLHDRLRLGVVSLLQVTRNVEHTTSICERHHDALIHLALILIDLLDNRIGYRLDTFCTTVEVADGSLEGIFCQYLTRLVDILFTGEGHLHSEDMQELFLTALIVTGVLNDIHHTVPDDVGDIHTDTLTHQGVTTFLVDDGTLFVHHVIIFNQTLTDTEVVLLNFLLGALDTLRDHRTLNHLTLLETQTVHHGGDTL